MTRNATPPVPAMPTPPATVQALPRRQFGLLLSSAGLVLLGACSKRSEPATPATPAAADPAPAPASTAASAGTAGTGLPMLDPADPAAQAQAYVADAGTLDATRNPPFQAGQACGNCALFGGQPGQAAGPCPLYAGRQVSAQGWCKAYVKKLT